MSDSATPSLEIFQVWNKPAQTAKIRKKLKNNTAEDQAREQNNGLLCIHKRKLANFTDQNTERVKHKIYVLFRELAKQVKRKISFETWKKKKSLIYRKLLREAEEKRRQELQQKMQETERKKASQEASTLYYFYHPMQLIETSSDLSFSRHMLRSRERKKLNKEKKYLLNDCG